MKKFIYLAVFALLLLSAGGASAEIKQTAFAEEPVLMYAKPAEDAKSWEVSLPEKGANVPSAIRDKEGALWYKVKVGGKEGWIKSEGVYLKMGAKSKTASNILKSYAKARDKFFTGKGPGDEWQKQDDVDFGSDVIMSWISPDTLIQTINGEKSVKDIFFVSHSAKDCKNFLGFPAVGMTETELRKKMGTPTARGSDKLYYELSDKDAVLTFTLVDYKDVAAAELSVKPPKGEEWPEEVLSIRENLTEARF